MAGQGSDKSLSRHRQPPSAFQLSFSIELLPFNIAQAPTPLSFFQFSFRNQHLLSFNFFFYAFMMAGQDFDSSLDRHRQPPSFFQLSFNIEQTRTPLYFSQFLFNIHQASPTSVLSLADLLSYKMLKKDKLTDLC